MNNMNSADTTSPKLLNVEEARAFLLERARVVAEEESVATGAALGRVLAAAQTAPFDVPGYDNSSMDGYAVVSADFATDEEIGLPVTQRIAAGTVGGTLKPGEAARIFTGAPVPPGADAVVMQEHTRVQDDKVFIRGPVEAGRFIRPRGNDIASGDGVLEAGSRLRAPALGLAASVGLAELPVYRRLRVAMFSSGDEIREPGDPLQPGQIYNSNRFSLMGLLGKLPCELLDLGTVEDSLAATENALREAANAADLIITSGGVSVGDEDYIKQAVENTGHLDLWRISVKPGKPLAYGRVGEADFVGLPGNPVSAVVTFCLFVRPFILRRCGAQAVEPMGLPVRSGFEWAQPGRRREYLRVRLERGEDGAVEMRRYPKQGSDVLTSTVWADGFAEVPADTPVSPGDVLNYFSLAELLD